MNKQRQAYYQDFANSLARQIVPPDELKPFVGNHPDLVGAFAEAQVRKFVRQVVFPLRVSHGAIIAAESYGDKRAQQVDTIIWTPNPLPPLFEVGDFAFIPWTSSMGILEIKSSAYPGAGEAIAKVLGMEGDLTCGRKPAETRGIPAALGVVVLERKPITDSMLKNLIANHKVVVLLHREDTTYRSDTEAMLKFVNFLADVRRRALQLGDLRVEPRGHNVFRGNSATAL
jgi:hypothetical protein